MSLSEGRDATDVIVSRGFPARGPCLPVTARGPRAHSAISMRLRPRPHILIPRNLHSASQRLPRSSLLFIADTARHSLNPSTVSIYNRFYNSSLASSPTSLTDANSDAITQRLPSDSSQSTPMREYSKLVGAGKLRSDDYQTPIIQKLQALHDALALYDPLPPAGPSLVRISPLPFCYILSCHHSHL